MIDASPDDFGDYRALCAAQPDTLVPASVDADALFNIMFSSGTTGLPKGIMHSHRVRAMYCTLAGIGGGHHDHLPAQCSRQSP